MEGKDHRRASGGGVRPLVRRYGIVSLVLMALCVVIVVAVLLGR